MKWFAGKVREKRNSVRPRRRRSGSPVAGFRRLTTENLERRELLTGNTISDSGGFEGSQKTLELETNGGGILEYRYEHYTIPDNFIIRYEGKNLFETGFVGGRKSGKIQIPEGQSKQIEVIVATNNQGTAWNYTVSADTCGDTGDFILELANGEFEAQTAADGSVKCVGTGTVFVGRSDGISRMLRVDNANAEYDKSGFKISGTVHSEIGVGPVLNSPLFTGSFEVPFTSGTSSSFSETGGGNSEFELAGQDVDFSSITITNNSLALTPHFKTPTSLGLGDALFSGPDGLVITQNDVMLSPSFKASLPDFKNIDLFGFVSVKELSDLGFEYKGNEDTLRLQGKLIIDVLPSDSRGELTLDLSGNNFIQIKGTEVDVKGEFTAQTGIGFGKTDWGLDELKLAVDTIAKDISGSAKFELGKLAKGLPAREAVIGAGFKYSPVELNSLSVGVDNLNWPVAFWPQAFWQGFDASINNIASSDLDELDFSGKVKATLGPLVSVPGLGSIALISADVGGSISSERWEGTGSVNILHPNVINASGTLTADWSKHLVGATAQFDILAGFIKTSDSLKVSTSNYSFNMGGSAAVSIPTFVPLIGGAQLSSANYLVDVAGASTDFAAAWTTFNIQKLGIELNFVAGAKCELRTADCEFIGSKNIPPTGSYEIEPNTPWVILAADWETSTSGGVAVTIEKPDGTVLAESDFAANNIVVLDELSDGNTRAVLVANPEPGIWDILLDDESGLGTVNYSAFSESIAPTIAVTSVQRGQNDSVQITYDAFDADSDADIVFFYDDDNSGFDGIRISGEQLEQDGAGVFQWDTTGVPIDDYHVYAMIFDGDNPPMYSYAPQSVTVDESANLLISSILAPTSIDSSESPTYQFRVANLGASAAENVIVELDLPTGRNIESVSGTVLNVDGNVVSISLGTIDAGNSSDLEVQLSSSGSDTSLQLAARAYADTFDPIYDNNTEIVSTVVRQPAFAVPDLAVSVVASNVDISAGESFSYDVIVANNGTAVATNVLLQEFLPEQVSYQSSSSTNGDVTFHAGTHRVDVSFASIAPGHVEVVTFTVRAFAAGDLLSSSWVTSDQVDLIIRDNQLAFVHGVNSTVPQAADLEISVTASTLVPQVGDGVTFEVVLSNEGPGIASGVKIKSNFPSQLSVVSSQAEQGTFDATTGIWDVGNIRDNLSRRLVIRTEVVGVGLFGSSFEIISVNESDPDSIPDNGVASEDDQANVDFNVYTIDAGGPYIGRVGEQIRFDASNSVDPEAPILFYEWDWNNDGIYDSFSVDPIAYHTFNRPAMSTVGLRTTNMRGGRRYDWADLMVYVPREDNDIVGSPLAELRGPYTGVVGEALTVQAVPSPEIVQYEWDWNDDGVYDNVTHVPTASHVYSSEYLGVVRLRTTDGNGSTYVDTADVTVSNPRPATPQLSNSVVATIQSRSVGFHGTAMTFDGSASFSSNAAIALYEWDWDGDGDFDTASTDSVVDHVFANGFLGTIALRVTDANGLANITYKDVTIF
ncbi:MAG: DUF11 domain-containing protein [Planctomycetales bacterium]|nr:DUF11 domain-containing protein [Planctomycetales bacterium]